MVWYSRDTAVNSSVRYFAVESLQIRLNPSMDVSDIRTALRLFVVVELAWRAQHRG